MNLSKNDVIELFELNGEGDINTLAYVAGNAVDRMDNNNNEINIDYLIKKYKSYLKWWKNKFGNRNKEYISARDALLTPEQFVEQRKHLQNFDINYKTDIRINYMFGNIKEIESKYIGIYGNN